MIPEESHLSCAISVFGTYRKKPEEEKKVAQGAPSQHWALQNWQRNMALRKKQQKMLSGNIKLEQIYSCFLWQIHLSVSNDLWREILGKFESKKESLQG